MEDEVISKFYQDLDTGIAPLFYYNIEITPDSQQSANFSTELSRTTIFTRLLVSGRAHTERCRPTRSSGALGSNRWRLEGFSPIPSTSTSFALYVGHKNPAEEGILLEAKVHPSGFAPGGYTWDIVGSKFLHGTFNITLTVHVWKVRPWGRTEIIYDSKFGMPRLRMIPTSDSSSEFLDEEQEFLLTLLESHWSRTSADALILNGLCLFSQSEDSNRAQYLDLAIRAVSTGLAYTQDPSPRPLFLRIFFCHLLFIRCTLPDGGIFVDKAFFTLQRLEFVPYTDDVFLVPFVDHVVKVYEEQKCADYDMIIHQVLGEAFFGDLHTHHRFRRNLYHHIPMDTKEDLDNFDQHLSLIGPSLPVDFHLMVLVGRALSYIRCHETTGDVDCKLVTSAIFSVQSHFLNHGTVEVWNRTLLCQFLHEGSFFLFARTFWEGPFQFNPRWYKTSLIGLLDFQTWALSLELEVESNNVAGVFIGLRQTKAVALVAHLWIPFHLTTAYFESDCRPLWMREIIRVIYNECPMVGEDALDFLKDQMLLVGDGKVATPARPPKAINDIIDYSLSTEPDDQITLIRVIIAATTARNLGCSVTLQAYQLLMSKADMFNYTWSAETFHGHHPLYTHIPFEAISFALELGQAELALEWLDQFCSTAWCRILHLRSSFTQVTTVDPRLGEELAAAASEMISISGGIFSGTRETAEHHARSMVRWHSAVSNARKLPGLGRFLAPKVFEEIQSAVNVLGGPVVYLNLNRFSSEALCVLPNLDEVLRIPVLKDYNLDYTSFMKILGWFDGFIQGTGTDEIPHKKSRGRVGKLVKPKDKKTDPMNNYITYPIALEYLWIAFVKPVLDGLGISRSQSTSAHNLPRIWWCPCGQMEALPLHAAGLYRNGSGGDNIMDYVVSSYIPSSSLLSHVTRAEITSQEPHFLAVANPSDCGLPGTMRELKIVREHLSNAGTITELVGASATPDAVRRELHSTTWAHFACHGVQVDIQGKLQDNSSLILANHTRLPIAEIAKLSLPQAQLAFLSACQTAQDLSLCRGESAHIAGAMLVAGFRSVVGTMWRISDYYAPFLADNFYKNILDGKSVPDYRDSAYALHDAVKALREKNPDTTVWVPFLHFGA